MTTDFNSYWSSGQQQRLGNWTATPEPECCRDFELNTYTHLCRLQTQFPISQNHLFFHQLSSCFRLRRKFVSYLSGKLPYSLGRNWNLISPYDQNKVSFVWSQQFSNKDEALPFPWRKNQYSQSTNRFLAGHPGKWCHIRAHHYHPFLKQWLIQSWYSTQHCIWPRNSLPMIIEPTHLTVFPPSPK